MLTKHEVIQRHGTSQAQFARDLGISRQRVQRWGDYIPPRWALRVSRLVDVPIEELLEDDPLTPRVRTEEPGA